MDLDELERVVYIVQMTMVIKTLAFSAVGNSDPSGPPASAST